ncbi:MAG TPA: ornithine cyclodeaminase family protein [Rhodocyclaceae bacterium]|nr:ornithine cyclodeaminase family protein [Rhodocyclaceae bacterium]HNH14115.1 ornithine cyclodeaminase family protein [Rhodocyclaceae bacterium]
MALFLSESDVEQLVDIALALDAVEAAHRAHGEGTAIDVPRQRTRLPSATMHILQGALPSEGVLGYKVYTSSREGNRFQVHLYDQKTGRQLAVIEANLLGMMRTGAMGGLSIKWLARENARVLGVFGSGWQARSQIEAACLVRPISEVKVYSRDRGRLERFCDEMTRRMKCPVCPAQNPEEVVRGSDVIITITTATNPLFVADWVAEGAHIVAAGSNSLIRREIDEATIRRASAVVVDSRATALREAGDLLPALEKGRLCEGQLIEIGEIIAGCRVGRRKSSDITLFESQGMAVQDVALGMRVLELARERGLGTELPF